MNKKNWTPHRRSGFDYFKTALSQEPRERLLLDVGAGERQFREIFDQFPNNIAMDFVPYPTVDVVADLTRRWPIADKAIDVIVSSNTFEHLPDTEHVLTECARVLKSGGRLVVSVPFLMGVHQAPYDFVRHTNFSWQRLLTAHGFAVEDFSAGGSVYDVHRAMRNKMFQYLYTAEPFSSHVINRLWRTSAKLLHRCVKFGEGCAYGLFFRFAPPMTGFTEGYLFSARKM